MICDIPPLSFCLTHILSNTVAVAQSRLATTIFYFKLLKLLQYIYISFVYDIHIPFLIQFIFVSGFYTFTSLFSFNLVIKFRFQITPYTHTLRIYFHTYLYIFSLCIYSAWITITLSLNTPWRLLHFFSTILFFHISPLTIFTQYSSSYLS